MDRIRQLVRWFFAAVFFAIFVAIVAGVLGEFFIEWAREQGWYQNPSTRLDTAMTAFSDFVTQTWFISTGALLAGLAAGSWIDRWLRRFSKPKKRTLHNISIEEAASLHAEIEVLKERMVAEGRPREAGVSRAVFYDASALIVKLTRLGVVTPHDPEQARRMEMFNDYTSKLYQYLCAVSPFVRDRDLKLANAMAQSSIEMMTEKLKKESTQTEQRARSKRESIAGETRRKIRHD